MPKTWYYLDISHPGLGTFQRIQATDEYVLRQRASAKMQEWEQRWQKLQAVARRKAQIDRGKQAKEQAKEEAIQRTRAAEEALAAIENLLAATLNVDDTVEFDSVKDYRPFAEARPVQPGIQDIEPTPRWPSYKAAAPSLFRRVFELFSPGTKARRLAKARAEQDGIRADDEAIYTKWKTSKEQLQAQYTKKLEDWKCRKQAYESRQAEVNRKVDELHRNYTEKETEAIEQYCDLVLSRSVYPDGFPQQYSLKYMAETRQIVVEYVLPEIKQLPQTKAVKYIQARNEFEEVPLPESAVKKLYDSALYQITIRTLHELFEADAVGVLDSITFNGVVETIEPATGKNIRPCILTIQATKEEFSELNLSAVDPKACFRKLKGIGSSQLHALAPVAPIMQLPRDDPRYIEGREVMGSVQEGTNLAAMDWEDFEHLIRQLFEREFCKDGAEVKVTRASRDGGVDAVVLDPDPIRGGKFVIQAKRYTNPVTVSAVRDLYGTMINEGAVKGILVTTSTYGPDSYGFAKDKPITLIDGGNLLHLLQKFGTKAYIDLKSAKDLLGSQ